MSSKKGKSQAVELYGADLRPSFWATCVVGSLIIHLAVLALVAFSPWGGSEAEWIRPGDTLKVDLVSFNPEVPAPPGEGGSQGGAEDAAEVRDDSGVTKTATEAESISESRDSKPRVISAKSGGKKNLPKDYELKIPEPDLKTSLKKKTFDPEKVIADAVSRMEKESKSNRPRALQERIARLEGEVGDEDYRKRLKERAGSLSGGMAADDLSAMEIYQAEVAVLLKRNWAFSPDMAGESTSGLETRLVIEIMPDGEIADVWFEKRSGNAYLDESAYKTVMKTNPLPPLPGGRSQYHLVIGFTPSGLTR
ncbi:MAG: TonB family protein [Desulfobacteraceae bacterium]|nr:TonB family protein [Desulfobacteraceae bacterium]